MWALIDRRHAGVAADGGRSVATGADGSASGRVGGRTADKLPGRPRIQRRRLVGEFGVVYLQRTAHGVAMLVRRCPLRAPAWAALSTPRPWPRLDVGRRTPAPARRISNRQLNTEEDSER
jgi:hypothetical protein